MPGVPGVVKGEPGGEAGGVRGSWGGVFAEVKRGRTGPGVARGAVCISHWSSQR